MKANNQKSIHEKNEKFNLGVKVMPEFGGTFLWDLSDGMGVCLGDYFEETDEVIKLEDELLRWNTLYELEIQPAVTNCSFNWDEFNENGLKLASRIKKLSSPNFRVVYKKAYEDPHGEDKVIEILD